MAIVTIVSVQEAHGQKALLTQHGTTPLYIDSSRCLVRFNDSLSTAQIMGIAQTLPRLSLRDSVWLHGTRSFVFHVANGQGIENYVDSVADLAGIAQCEPVYKMVGGYDIFLHQWLTVAFKQSVGRKFIDSVNNLMGTTIDHELLGMPNVFNMKKIGDPHLRMLDLSNFYSSLPQVIYACPDPGQQMQPQGYILYDFYNMEQWEMKKVIGTFNQATVWDFAHVNRNVLVAVADDGVESHEDLDSIRVDLGYDFADLDTIATPSPWSFHGMGVAGIIGAKHTTNPNQQGLQSTGMVSMNPHARIIPLKMTWDDGSIINYYQLPNVFTWAYQHGAAVINYSWSAGNPFIDWPPLDSAISNAFHNGRGGKGTPVLCASGDYALGGPLGYIDYPANLPFCLSVGSVDAYDQRFPWSMYGDSLGVVAPSGDTSFAGDFFTLDRMGALGLNPNITQYWGTQIVWDCKALKDTGNNTNYDCKYGGTSASTAVVSGVASLLISKDTNLTAPQIYKIIDSSAVPLGSGDTGHGRVDAFRAVLSISHGDVNNDGFIDLGDLSALVGYLSGHFVPFPSVKLGDWNCDGFVNLSDLSAIVSYLNGDPGSHPPKNPCFVF